MTRGVIGLVLTRFLIVQLRDLPIKFTGESQECTVRTVPAGRRDGRHPPAQVSGIPEMHRFAAGLSARARRDRHLEGHVAPGEGMGRALRTLE
jgi:hypothetical protein